MKNTSDLFLTFILLWTNRVFEKEVNSSDKTNTNVVHEQPIAVHILHEYRESFYFRQCWYVCATSHACVIDINY